MVVMGGILLCGGEGGILLCGGDVDPLMHKTGIYWSRFAITSPRTLGILHTSHLSHNTLCSFCEGCRQKFTPRSLEARSPF